jgi:hypothetical protein
MKTLFCVADGTNAPLIVEALKSNGFVSEQISIVLNENAQQNDAASDPSYTNRAGAGTAIGSVAGAGAGAALGWALTVGAAPILGPLLAARPLLAILGGAAVGGSTGGMLGAMLGAGMPQHHAKKYEERMHQGGIIMHDKDQLETAHRIFSEYGAEMPEKELHISSH